MIKVKNCFVVKNPSWFESAISNNILNVLLKDGEDVY